MNIFYYHINPFSICQDKKRMIILVSIFLDSICNNFTLLGPYLLNHLTIYKNHIIINVYENETVQLV